MQIFLQTYEAAPAHQRYEHPTHLSTNCHPVKAIMEDALPNLLCLRVDEQLYLGKPQPQRVDYCIWQVIM